MSYRIARDEPIRDAVRRIGLEQIDKALRRLEGPDDVVADVHDVRKRCKKVRALARLVRPSIGDQYAQINVAARDAARELGPIRDAQALLGTFDELVLATEDQLPSGGLAGVRAALQERADRAGAAVDAGAEHIERAGMLLTTARSVLEELEVDDDGWEAIGPGLRKTYRRGRRGMQAAEQSPSPEAFHEWRKRAKYTWYHIRLLRDAAPTILSPLARSFHDLSDDLGDDHDLAVLTAQLTAAPEELGGEEEVRAALRLIDGVAADLERRAFSLGSRLYAESGSAFIDRLGGYWRAWHEGGDEQRAGEIPELYPHEDGLDELSDDELRQRVRELDFVGRPGMSREMMLAVIRASGGR